MKTLKTILVLVFLSTFLQINAQTSEKKAKKFTDNITEVLSLTKEESEGVYKIHFARFEETKNINEEFKDDEETKKEKLKGLGNKVYKEMITLLGKEKMILWKEHQSKKN
jgi:L-amino acid N-acyltransferase YncA